MSGTHSSKELAERYARFLKRQGHGWCAEFSGSLCTVSGSRTPVDRTLRSALRALRQFVRHDHRLSPGFWWPVSAEAEDVIRYIEHAPTQTALVHSRIHSHQRPQP